MFMFRHLPDSFAVHDKYRNSLLKSKLAGQRHSIHSDLPNKATLKQQSDVWVGRRNYSFKMVKVNFTPNHSANLSAIAASIASLSDPGVIVTNPKTTV